MVRFKSGANFRWGRPEKPTIERLVDTADPSVWEGDPLNMRSFQDGSRSPSFSQDDSDQRVDDRG